MSHKQQECKSTKLLDERTIINTHSLYKEIQPIPEPLITPIKVSKTSRYQFYLSNIATELKEWVQYAENFSNRGEITITLYALKRSPIKDLPEFKYTSYSNIGFKVYYDIGKYSVYMKDINTTNYTINIPVKYNGLLFAIEYNGGAIPPVSLYQYALGYRLYYYIIFSFRVVDPLNITKRASFTFPIEFI